MRYTVYVIQYDDLRTYALSLRTINIS